MGSSTNKGSPLRSASKGDPPDSDDTEIIDIQLIAEEVDKKRNRVSSFRRTGSLLTNERETGTAFGFGISGLHLDALDQDFRLGNAPWFQK